MQYCVSYNEKFKQGDCGNTDVIKDEFFGAAKLRDKIERKDIRGAYKINAARATAIWCKVRSSGHVISFIWTNAIGIAYRVRIVIRYITWGIYACTRPSIRLCRVNCPTMTHCPCQIQRFCGQEENEGGRAKIKKKNEVGSQRFIPEASN